MGWSTEVLYDKDGKRTHVFHRSNLVKLGSYQHPYLEARVRDENGKWIACPICKEES